MDLFRFKKSIKFFMCTVLTIVVMSTSALSFSFTSHATTSIAMPMSVDSNAFLSAFYSYLLGHGIVPDNTTNPFNSDRVTAEEIKELYSWFDELNSYRSGLGDEVLSSLLSGTITLDMVETEEQRQELLAFVAANEGFSIGSLSKSFPTIPAQYVNEMIVVYHLTGNASVTYQDSITWSCNRESFLVELVPTNPSSNYNEYVCSGMSGSTFRYTINQHFEDYATPIGVVLNRSVTGNGNPPSISINLRNNGGGKYFTIDQVIFNTYTIPTVKYAWAFIQSVIARFLSSGVASYDEDITTSTVAPSGTEVISPSNTVASDGVLTGMTTYSIVALNNLLNIIDGVKSGVLSFADAIRALRLGTVSDDATQAEKQAAISDLAETIPATSRDDALTEVLTVPAGATATISDSVEEVSTVQHIAHSIANTIADIRGVPRPYPDEEPDVGPSGDPHIQGWDFPSLDPDNPDPGGSDPSDTEDDNRAADVINGLAFVSGFIGSFYDASKGFNMVFTVGISFVIFSVIIGASHFFGALFGSHTSVNGPSTIKELNASREAQIRVQQRAYQRSLKQHHSNG